ncbi:ABC transporter substrate-binding protein [Vreelandella massiliensis]|uniref:ABC transporter substrate-binding protein n=1 Tax=Vreelandella massiliensis TaxID=1816686 RepID=UPI00096A25C0|nr:ABC transporter substrate-binding protein [Halomonas massiliensis]
MRLVLFLAGLAMATSAVAETRTVEGANGSIEVPAEPKRIVSLNDASITHPLIELGAPVVASHGRLESDGTPYLRGVRDLRGEGFEDHDIAFLGAFNQLDVERIAALAPDLIIAPPWQQEVLPGLERIAPVVILPWSEQGSLEVYRLIAEAAGRLEQYEHLLAGYRERVDELRDWLGDSSAIRVAMLQAQDSQVSLYGDYGAFSQVAEDVGFGAPALVGDYAGAELRLSSELLPDLEADFVFDTFEPNFGDTPEDPAKRFEQALPGWCEWLFACRNRQYVLLERSKIMGESFDAYHYVLDQLTTHIAGRDYVLQD